MTVELEPKLIDLGDALLETMDGGPSSYFDAGPPGMSRTH